MRIYKSYFFIYLTALFFCELLLPLQYPFPLLTAGLVVSPLFFGFGYSIMAACFWGIIMGAVSYRVPFLYLVMYCVNVLGVTFIIRKLDNKLFVYTVSSVLAGIVYCVSVGAVGEIPAGVLLRIGLSMSVFCVLQAYVVEQCIYYRHD